jgi:hypothetical protein
MTAKSSKVNSVAASIITVAAATGIIESRGGVVFAAGDCSSNYSVPAIGNLDKNTAYQYAAIAQGDHYENVGSNTACWNGNHIPDGSGVEGTDCSGFVGKVWGLAPTGWSTNGGWYAWNKFDTRRTISTGSLWNVTNASWGDQSKSARSLMDAGVIRETDATGTHGHIFLEVAPSADGTSDYIIDAAGHTATPQVGHRYKDVNTKPYQWKYRKNWK